MKVWKAFRESIFVAAVITAVIWMVATIPPMLGSDSEAPGSEQLEPLSTRAWEQAVLVAGIGFTFAVVFILVVACWLVRTRVRSPRRA